ncbi:MAG: hypothetical protein CMM58_08605 [Rhodospirillaceae bacterium]|nr:hypothetical protein [Rhodospirillaceae bacterium]|tara:strand:+ start:426 stop:932 length:507 start_codon:yes stop_codon:yes gene_type:complete
MTYTLQQFSDDCRRALQNDSGPGGLELVRQSVSKACSDKDFVAEHLGPDNNEARKLLYEDPDLGFCIFAHVYTGERGSPPHDHGPSWAIYGQAVGTTQMTDWKCLKKPSKNEPGLVEEIKTYTLEPGMAYSYQVGDLHSPYRSDTTKLIRVEGMNMDYVKRDSYMVAS